MKRIKECNEPGVDVFNLKGIDKKLNNLLGFDDFEKTFKPKEQKSTKRTDVGLDILNEEVINDEKMFSRRDVGRFIISFFYDMHEIGDDLGKVSDWIEKHVSDATDSDFTKHQLKKHAELMKKLKNWR